MGKIYTLVNQKGGVGKTTTAINLGSYLGYYGQRILLVDLDPQANATSCLGIDKLTVKNGTYEVLSGSAPIAAHILHNPRLKISLLPSSPALSGAEVEMIDIPNREFKLREVLGSISDRYDYILIDCPPSLNLLTVNGLVAAREGVIIPVQCEYLALEGLGQLIQTLNKVRARLFPELQVRGVVMTMYDGRTKLAMDVVAEVKKHFPVEVFKTVIPRSIRIAEAPSYGIPLTLYAPDSTGARAYNDLAGELLAGDGINLHSN